MGGNKALDEGGYSGRRPKIPLEPAGGKAALEAAGLGPTPPASAAKVAAAPPPSRPLQAARSSRATPPRGRSSARPALPETGRRRGPPWAFRRRARPPPWLTLPEDRGRLETRDAAGDWPRRPRPLSPTDFRPFWAPWRLAVSVVPGQNRGAGEGAGPDGGGKDSAWGAEQKSGEGRGHSLGGQSPVKGRGLSLWGRGRSPWDGVGSESSGRWSPGKEILLHPKTTALYSLV